MDSEKIRDSGVTVTLAPPAGGARYTIKLGNVGAASLKPVSRDGKLIQAQRISAEGMRELEGAVVKACGLEAVLEYQPKRPEHLRGRVAPEGWRERVYGKIIVPLEDCYLKVVVEARLTEPGGDVARLRTYGEFRPIELGREWAPKPTGTALEVLSGGGQVTSLTKSRSRPTRPHKKTA